jgi:hypothetical protein
MTEKMKIQQYTCQHLYDKEENHKIILNDSEKQLLKSKSS